jgi:hypothetical protein
MLEQFGHIKVAVDAQARTNSIEDACDFGLRQAAQQGKSTGVNP